MRDEHATIILGKNLGEWDGAIEDARRKIAETKLRLARLKAALHWFESQRESGEPFPSEKPKRRSRKAKK